VAKVIRQVIENIIGKINHPQIHFGDKLAGLPSEYVSI